ncbi:DUF2339 domain-containing protein [Mucilaginibacter flavus]|uniref:DUF2339 domain-containing protein n=1 Tax=Mucilaginibacter flavus TaxID=931504 RepID=UPI0025B387DB|nr:DUF2339 domain-containing protein [Mucilaginibacter flavus]MDN3583588.1 DUF2339 domain-containing protein [Mucilaginibacter flavus]
MDILTLFVCLLIVILVINSKGSITRQLNKQNDELQAQILQLKLMIDQLRRLASGDETAKSDEKPKPVTKEAPVVKTPDEPIVVTPVIPVVVEVDIKAELVEPLTLEKQSEVISDSLSTIHRPVKTNAHIPPTPAEPKPSFFESHPDLEKFIGENLINKIGIAILVLAIGYFVKFAIDNNWVGPLGRIGIGVACGAILIGIAHRLRNSYKAFSSVLAGGGLAVFYFIITLGHHQFHLPDSQVAAFVILIVITIFAVLLALLYDKQELAVIALVGGFASPFMVSTGKANYDALFIYLLILNTGLLVIAYYKAWRVLNIVSFAFTVLVFGGVVYTLTPATYHYGFIYASIFYVLYFAINVANNVKENKKFIGSDFSILLLNTGLYFGVGLYLLTMMHEQQFRGLFCVSLAVVNLVLSYILFRNRKVDTNVLYLLIGITLTFISLAAPIQLHGNSITLFWATETVLLYWLYLRSSIKLMRLTSLILYTAMLLSLFMDWYQIYIYQQGTLTIIANKGFITTLVAAVSSSLMFVLIRRDQEQGKGDVKISPYIFSTIGLALLFLSGLLEVNHQFSNRYPETSLNILYMMLYTPAFIYAYYLVSLKVTVLRFNDSLRIGILVVAITIYLAVMPGFFSLLTDMLTLKKTPLSHYSAHWISALFICLLFYRLIRLCQSTLDAGMKTLFTWIISAGVVAFLSLEICLLSNLLFYSKMHDIDRIETVYIKTTLPILWGLLSFALMWLGMRYKMRTMRIVSLSLFSLTLLKLFLFDIVDIPQAGKIAAFFCLGILLLIISFMYQKVKKIIVDDETTKKADEPKEE